MQNLTFEERVNITKGLNDWRDQVLKGNMIPIILIAVPKGHDPGEAIIFRGGEYTPQQLAEYLRVVAKNVEIYVP